MNTIFKSSIAVLFFSFLVSTLHSQNASEFLNQGRTLQDAERWQDASDMYSQALSMSPDLEAALFNRAECSIQLKDFAQATKDLNLLLKDSPNDMQALERRGIAEFYQNNWMSAAQDFSRVLDSMEVIDVRLNRASAFLKLDMPEEALQDILVCEKYEPGAPRLHAVFGDYFSYKNDYLNSVGQYKKALLADEKNAEVLNNIGVLEMQNENSRIAEQYFEKAIAVNPDARIYAHLALAQMDNKNFIDAMDNVALSLEMNPNESIAHFVKGRFKMENGNYAAALASFNQAISIDSKYTAAYLQRAKANRNLNQLEESELDLRKVLELDAENEEARGLLTRE